MSEIKKDNDLLATAEAEANEENEEYSLNDDRRVKTLSPWALVMKRFLRNRVAVTGIIILAAMVVFSFVGGLISPYSQDQLFYRYDEQNKKFAAVVENKTFRYVSTEGSNFSSLAKARFVLATTSGSNSFEADGTTYTFTKEGNNLYTIKSGDEVIAIASYNIVSPNTKDASIPFEVQLGALKAFEGKTKNFEVAGKKYVVSEDGGITADGEDFAYVSKYSIQAVMSDVFLSREFKDSLLEAIEKKDEVFTFTDKEGLKADYILKFDAPTNTWNVLQSVKTKLFDTYSSPSGSHWLGTDRNGMDMLTRLMYGGRVSLYIGFIVVFIETLIGVVMGGVSGYFGGWVDNLIMRMVDVFYCIPSLPIIIILGAMMDAMRVNPQTRMIYLMLILGFLGWAGIARLVRGQILSLREQEYMTATEACGIRVSRRIFRHLIPNVIPQLIVAMTMSLGSTILTEATLSFLGLGVKFPFASWGNIINDVNDTYVLTNYWFIWIPAGFCLLVTVLAFNLVGDGLRDAFDPKMKR